MKQKYFLLTILILSHLYGCNDNEKISNLIDPSISLIEMEGEGGETEISFSYPDWKIAGIVNLQGNVNISGDSYSLDGSPIQKNHTLKLDSLGRLDAIWENKGFSLIRTSTNSLKLILNENSTGEDFNFVIVLASENESKEILVRQKKSQGYTFKKIEYKLDENDGDSLFVKQGSSFSFDLTSPQVFTLYPINGIDMVERSFFKSDDENAFVWTESDSIAVQIPSGILNNELYFNGEESIYTHTTIHKESAFSKLKETVTIPSGKSTFWVDIQYSERSVSYMLTLINNRTQAEKVINGKWIEIAPTGNYTIKWQ
jgi:hypothetical protein